jgi:hypothetical protein
MRLLSVLFIIYFQWIADTHQQQLSGDAQDSVPSSPAKREFEFLNGRIKMI